MILPTKRLSIDRCMLGLGAEIIRTLNEPKTVSRLWDEINGSRTTTPGTSLVTYDWFVLTLDLLFALRGIELREGTIRRFANDPAHLQR